MHMTFHLNHRELSAYVDGEAKRLERIARHLQQCPACAKAHVALHKLSANIQGMTPPAAGPGFAERVVREIQARDANRRPASQPRWQRWGMPLAAAAALLIVGLVLKSVEGPVGDPAASPSDALQAALVEGMLETPAADTADTSWLFAANNKPELKPASDTVIQLARLEWDAPVRWDGQRDMGWTLGSVAHNDTKIVLSVLTDYARADR
jgi:predicted anti-sigma-YlaC factor YlaD